MLERIFKLSGKEIALRELFLDADRTGQIFFQPPDPIHASYRPQIRSTLNDKARKLI
ncbi:MAG: hypothetical protein SWY16_18870 [Cyanobacteriota bacterium]|nr:hypothetical protein [Cyanobacteriota bacterium]